VGLHYIDLDTRTREFMRAESDLCNHYASPRLTPQGLATWVPLLNAAIEKETDAWLGEQLRYNDHMKNQEPYTRNGKQFWRKINVPFACEQLAEGEFNRYYLRGLCRRALQDGIPALVVYRGKMVREPRPESEAKIGMFIDAQRLLDALRSNDFVSIEDALAVPGGPSSGLTARLP
jgi:hypothetical protein